MYLISNSAKSITEHAEPLATEVLSTIKVLQKQQIMNYDKLENVQ